MSLCVHQVSECTSSVCVCVCVCVYVWVLFSKEHYIIPSLKCIMTFCCSFNRTQTQIPSPTPHKHTHTHTHLQTNVIGALYSRARWSLITPKAFIKFPLLYPSVREYMYVSVGPSLFFHPLYYDIINIYCIYVYILYLYSSIYCFQAWFIKHT